MITVHPVCFELCEEIINENLWQISVATPRINLGKQSTFFCYIDTILSNCVEKNFKNSNIYGLLQADGIVSIFLVLLYLISTTWAHFTNSFWAYNPNLVKIVLL